MCTLLHVFPYARPLTTSLVVAADLSTSAAMVLRDDVELLNSITDSVRERPFRSAVEEMQHKAQQLLSQAQQQRMPRTPSRPASPRRADSRPASPVRGLEGQGSYLGNFLKRNQLLSSPKHGYYSPPVSNQPQHQLPWARQHAMLLHYHV